MRPLSSEERKDKVRLYIYVDKEVDKELRDYAIREEISLSTIVNRALKDYLKRLKVEVETKSA